MTRRKFKGNINPVLILGTPENEDFISLYPDDPSADCTEPTWQSLIRLNRNRIGGKLQKAKMKEKLWRESLIARRELEE